MGWLFPAELIKLLFVTPFLSGFGKLGLEPCSQCWVLAGAWLEGDSFAWHPIRRKASLPVVPSTPACHHPQMYSTQQTRVSAFNLCSHVTFFPFLFPSIL